MLLRTGFEQPQGLWRILKTQCPAEPIQGGLRDFQVQRLVVEDQGRIEPVSGVENLIEQRWGLPRSMDRYLVQPG